MSDLLAYWPAIVAVLSAVFLLVSMRQRVRRARSQPTMSERIEDDATDPARRWVQGAFMIVTGDCDYGYLARGEAHRMLVKWWQVHGPRDHARVTDELEAAGGRDNAWDLVRFIVVMRLGAAAGHLEQGDSWHCCSAIIPRLQQAYPSWPELAAAYLNARRQWQGAAPDGTEDDAVMQRISENIAHLREHHWPEIPFESQP